MTDNDPSYADLVYGGAGRDVLIDNVADDRLIDWSGEFNNYIVPFNPFGLGTVIRSSNGATEDFLYKVSRSDGTDPTLVYDTPGTDSARYGKPYGELGLITQKDPAWQDQSGSSRDPQPGNKGGGGGKTPKDSTKTKSTSTQESGAIIIDNDEALSGGTSDGVPQDPVGDTDRKKHKKAA